MLPESFVRSGERMASGTSTTGNCLPFARCTVMIWTAPLSVSSRRVASEDLADGLLQPRHGVPGSVSAILQPPVQQLGDVGVVGGEPFTVGLPEQPGRVGVPFYRCRQRGTPLVEPGPGLMRKSTPPSHPWPQRARRPCRRGSR